MSVSVVYWHETKRDLKNANTQVMKLSIHKMRPWILRYCISKLKSSQPWFEWGFPKKVFGMFIHSSWLLFTSFLGTSQIFYPMCLLGVSLPFFFRYRPPFWRQEIVRMAPFFGGDIFNCSTLHQLFDPWGYPRKVLDKEAWIHWRATICWYPPVERLILGQLGELPLSYESTVDIFNLRLKTSL